MPAFRKLSLRDAQAVESVEGLHWVPVRRVLDVGAFGVNAFRALYARMGDDDRALAELAGAIEANPQAAERAREDEVFATLRDDPRWPCGD